MTQTQVCLGCKCGWKSSSVKVEDAKDAIGKAAYNLLNEASSQHPQGWSLPHQISVMTRSSDSHEWSEYMNE